MSSGSHIAIYNQRYSKLFTRRLRSARLAQEAEGAGGRTRLIISAILSYSAWPYFVEMGFLLFLPQALFFGRHKIRCGTNMKEYIPVQIRIPLGRMKREMYKYRSYKWVRRLTRRILLELERPTGFNKTDLIHLISKRLELGNYLELCTPTAGGRYGELDRARFLTARRLMYMCPADFGDGLPIDYRIADLDIGKTITHLKLSGNRIDICLVDALHTYDFTNRDLTCAYELLADGGVLVVHDCSPMTEEQASPIFSPYAWCGESYRSYLDFVLSRDDLDYCTVDVDYGCGIIFKNRSVNMVGRAAPNLVAEWFDMHKDPKLALRFFFENRATLLRLVSGKHFVQRFGRSIVRSIKGSAAKSSSYHLSI
jgi:Methyltransferase domain